MPEFQDTGTPKERMALPTAVTSELQGLVESREAAQPRQITDEDNFERTEFTLDATTGVTIVFRDPEELPKLDQPEGTISAVLDPYETPLRTSRDDYGRWLSDTTQGQPTQDPFERASQQGAESIRFIAPSTPHGIVSAAIELAEHGVLGIANEQLEHLKVVLKDIDTRNITEDVLDLYDKLFAACAVTIADGQVVVPDEYSWINPNEAGLLEVLMLLAGDEAAERTIQTKQEFVAAMDQRAVQQFVDERRANPGQEKASLKQPGEVLTDAELELMASKHLVGVHTSPVQPYFVGGGTSGPSVIRPTSEFGEKGTAKLPRNTLHWSLNHPVISHINGNFSARPFTIVAPFEDIAQVNGAPAVLYGVDSYYATNPGEGMLLPESAAIIQTITDSEAPGIEIDGSIIRLKAGNLTTADMEDILSALTDGSLPGLTDSSEIDRESALLLLSRNLMGAYGSAFSTEIAVGINQYHHPQAVADLEQYPMLAEEVKGLAINAEFMALLDTFSPQSGAKFAELSDRDQKRAFEQFITALFTQPGLIEDHPNIQPIFVEAMRQELVRLQIRKLGGKVVQSDGMGAYIEDRAFSADVQDVTVEVGLRTGLHKDQPESDFEYFFNEAIRGATRSVNVPAGVQAEDSNAPRTEQADFVWQDYTEGAETLWSALRLATPATRRMAIDMGLLPHAERAMPKGPMVTL